LLSKVKGLFLFLLYIIMKQNTTIILMILGFLIFASLCICTAPSMEGLDTMKTNTHVLRRGEYMTDAGYLKSKDGGYVLSLGRGNLTCFVKKKHTRKPKHIWQQLWSMNAKGSKIMLLNDSGSIQFKTSRNSEPITTPMSKGSVTGSSLVLTSYGTLELKSGSNGTGTTLFTYPVTEGFADDADDKVTALMGALDTVRSTLTRKGVRNLNSYFGQGDSGTSTHIDKGLRSAWTTFYNANSGDDADWSSTAKSKAEDVDDTDEIPNGGGHNKLLKNGRKLRRLQNTLDSKIQVLNQLGDSHVTEKQIHLDSTIYISLVWTVIASSLVYYTFTQ
jgi:hypothetical protein